MKYFLLFTILCGATICISQEKHNGPDTLKPSVPDKNLQRIQQLKQDLAGANEELSFDIRFELFGRYLGIEPDTAMVFLNKCIEQAKESGDSLWMVKTSNANALVLRNKGDLTGAIRIFESLLPIAKRNNFSDQVKYLLNNLALSYTTLASFEKALKCHFESLKIREAECNPLDISVTLNNIGIVYHEMSDFQNAYLFYNRSYMVKLKNNVKHDIERSLLNIGVVMIDLDKPDIAESKIRDALGICVDSNCSSDLMLEVYKAMGVILLKQKKYTESENYFLKSLRLSQVLGLSNRCASNYYWLACVKFSETKVGEAIKYLDMSQVLAERSRFQNTLLKNYLLYTKIYIYQKDYLKAIEFQTKYNQLNSEILNGDLIGKISRIQTDYEERGNIAKIFTQSKIMALQEAAIRQQQLVNLSLGAVGCLSIGFVIVLFRNNKQKHGINRILDQLVKERTLELQSNSVQLKHAHDEQTVILHRVASDMTTTLATFRGLSNTASVDLKPEQAIYFKKAEVTVERVVNYVNKHLVPN